jgi:hypothetical protein
VKGTCLDGCNAMARGVIVVAIILLSFKLYGTVRALSRRDLGS